VRRGDTLWTIARRHGTSVEELKAANQLRNPDIRAGQRLVIPTNSR
jgi:LysM repeat protein